MPLTPQEVASKVFGPTRLRRGYDENEVDAFLDQVEAELAKLTAENERLRQELTLARGGRLPDPPPGDTRAGEQFTVGAAADFTKGLEAGEASPAAEPVGAGLPALADDAIVEQRVTRMLVLAQQTADAVISEAQAEADRTRGGARVEAERILAEARSRVADEMSGLERSKSLLEGEVEHLQSFEQEYRQRLRAYLEMQLQDLEANLGGGPAAVEGRGVDASALDPRSQLSRDERHPGGGTFDGGTYQLSGDPAMVAGIAEGMSDPPGFGPVWSPGESSRFGADQQVTDLPDHPGAGNGSPFGTGEGTTRFGGFDSAP